MAARVPAEQRRRDLVDAAFRTMSQLGIKGATTRAICAEAGVNQSVFHYCFRSKDELIGEVARTINQRSFGAVEEVLARTDDPAELIRGCIDAYWQHVLKDPLEALLIFELTHFSLRQPGWEAAARASRTGNLESVDVLLAMVAGKGGFEWRSPVDVLARYVLATIEGITFQWVVHRDVEWAEELFGQLVNHLYDEAGLTTSLR